jgi:hypothetical protein
MIEDWRPSEWIYRVSWGRERSKRNLANCRPTNILVRVARKRVSTQNITTMRGRGRNAAASVRNIADVASLQESCGLPEAQVALLRQAVQDAASKWTMALQRAIPLPLWMFTFLACDPRAAGVVDWFSGGKGIMGTHPRAVLAFVLPHATLAHDHG